MSSFDTSNTHCLINQGVNVKKMSPNLYWTLNNSLTILFVPLLELNWYFYLLHLSHLIKGNLMKQVVFHD